jgi:hypothetical protein
MFNMFEGQGRTPEIIQFTCATIDPRMEVGAHNHGFHHQTAKDIELLCHDLHNR